jgi:hypothetical protein
MLNFFMRGALDLAGPGAGAGLAALAGSAATVACRSAGTVWTGRRGYQGARRHTYLSVSHTCTERERDRETPTLAARRPRTIRSRPRPKRVAAAAIRSATR